MLAESQGKEAHWLSTLVLLFPNLGRSLPQSETQVNGAIGFEIIKITSVAVWASRLRLEQMDSILFQNRLPSTNSYQVSPWFLCQHFGIQVEDSSHPYSQLTATMPVCEINS